MVLQQFKNRFIRMLYQNEDSFTPSLKINEQNVLLLDLSVINRQFCMDIFQRIASESNSSSDRISGQFLDAIISPIDLNFKIKAIVLPCSCFWRQFQPLEQQNLPHPQTVYQFLKQKYQNMLTVGVKVDLLNLSGFQKLKSEGLDKKIKLFSFDLHQSQLQEQLPILREFIKQYFSVKSKRMFHISIYLIDAKGLKILKKQMIDQEYPMQYCTIQSNFLNVIQDTFSKDMQNDWQQIAFKYCQVIKKYVPSGIGSLLEGYKMNKDKEISLSSLYSCINHINRRNSNQQKQYKKHHHTGIGTIEPIIHAIAHDFTPTLYGHIRVRSDFDLYLGKLYDAVTGNYKVQQRSYQVEDMQM